MVVSNYHMFELHAANALQISSIGRVCVYMSIWSCVSYYNAYRRLGAQDYRRDRSCSKDSKLGSIGLTFNRASALLSGLELERVIGGLGGSCGIGADDMIEVEIESNVWNVIDLGLYFMPTLFSSAC